MDGFTEYSAGTEINSEHWEIDVVGLDQYIVSTEASPELLKEYMVSYAKFYEEEDPVISVDLFYVKDYLCTLTGEIAREDKTFVSSYTHYRAVSIIATGE